MANAKIIKSDWKAPGAAKPLAAAMRTLGDTLANTRGENGINIQRRGGRLSIVGEGATTFPWSKLCLGFSISGSVVTITAGEVQWGTQTVQIPDTPVTIDADYQYVGVWSSMAGAGIILPSTDIALFRPDADTWRRWLYQFRRIAVTANGKQTFAVRLARIGWGNIMLPALGAPA